MKPTLIAPSKQRGSMLLESLIAILLFSVGILAIVGLQAAAIKNSSDAKYRADAALLANQLIGQMWAADHTQLYNNFGSSVAGATVNGVTQYSAGTSYSTWKNKVATTLPGVDSTTLPTVDFNGSTITITLRWKLPSEPAGTQAHKYVTTAQII